MKRIIEFLLYNGSSREVYLLVRPLAKESNRHSVCAFSIIGFLAFFTAAVLKQDNAIGVAGDSFTFISLLFLVMAVTCFKYGKKRACICELYSYIIIATILGVGIYSAISQPTQRTTLLLVFFVLSSMMFYSSMLWDIIIIAAAELLFIYLLNRTQTGQIRFENLVNSLIFSVVGIASSMYLMRVKCERFEYEVKSKNLLERDAMTSLYNRYSFNLKSDEIERLNTPVTVCNLDVNGLKTTNDSLGHLAGDELIMACAQCISDVFGKYGDVFRVGGDEFIAILDGVNHDEAELMSQLRERCAAWKGTYVNGFTVSCGIAKTGEGMPLEKALKASDNLMYEDKKHYHQGSV